MARWLGTMRTLTLTNPRAFLRHRTESTRSETGSYLPFRRTMTGFIDIFRGISQEAKAGAETQGFGGESHSPNTRIRPLRPDVRRSKREATTFHREERDDENRST